MKNLYFTLVIAAFSCFFRSHAQSIIINELVASNTASYADETGSFEDWIELYNPGGQAVNLADYYITDDAEDLQKFRLPANVGSINSNSFFILWASGIPSRGPKHLGFGLSAAGEQLLLVMPDGVTIVDQVDFEKQRTDISYGRKTIGSPELVFFSPSSPNASNVVANAYTGVASAPVFNTESGFFQNSFSLIISSTEAGSEIYYTLDGSEPNKNNLGGTGYRYKNVYPENPGDATGPDITGNSYVTLSQASPASVPISDRSGQPDILAAISTTYNLVPTYNSVPVKPVYKGTVVRAKVYATGKLPSETISRTYLFTPDGQPKSTLPVISIKTNPDNIFDYEKGIGVAGKDFVDWRNANPLASKNQLPIGNFFRTSEVPANFEMLIDGSPVLNQEIGVRVHGNFSRNVDKKSFRLYSTGSNASESEFDYPLFPSQSFHTFKRLLLRNSGNDYERTLFKDSFVQQIGKGLNVELQDYRPVTTYLNGEYWGIHNLTERQDEYYYASHYGLDSDNIEFFADPGIDNTSGDYESVDNFVKTQNMADQGNYNYVKTKFDVDNLIDYSVLELYAANWDWPYGNVTYWRNKVPYNPSAGNGKDGRWRWSVFDVDLSFEEYWADQFPKALGQNGNGTPTFVLKYMLPNLEFRNKFINRYADLINSHFKPQRLIDQIYACKNAIATEMVENIKRWNRPASFGLWESNVNLMVEFATKRPSYVLGHIQSQFQLTNGTRNVVVNVSNKNHGYVRVNTINIVPETIGIPEDPYPWTGTYFKDVLIKITAIPKPGFKFVQWELVGTGVIYNTPSLEFAPSNVSNYRAVFEADVAAVMNPAPLGEGACSYQLLEWSASAPKGSFPPNMAFVYMDTDDPQLGANIAGFTSGVYNFPSRTRISGLGANGLSFINTSGSTPNEGYVTQRLGGAILALNTTGKTQVNVRWTAGTVTPNFRPYAIRLQYRLSDTGVFKDVLNSSNQPIEYIRNPTAGHQQVMDWVKLPDAALNQPYVQLFWRYYNTDPVVSGARAELRLDDIEVMSCSSPLPVTLVNFEATKMEQQVVLSWKTTEEVNNDHFDVERSADARTWSVIASVPGYGNSNKPNEYETIDELPLDGKSYYRLKQVDLDGTYMYSRMVTLTREKSEAINIYPNPVKGILEVSLPAPFESFYYRIVDITGRVRTDRSFSNAQQLSIPVQNFESGLYIIQIESKSGTKRNLKFMKE